jgi:hypothetical protein
MSLSTGTVYTLRQLGGLGRRHAADLLHDLDWDLIVALRQNRLIKSCNTRGLNARGKEPNKSDE